MPLNMLPRGPFALTRLTIQMFGGSLHCKLIRRCGTTPSKTGLNCKRVYGNIRIAGREAHGATLLGGSSENLERRVAHFEIRFRKVQLDGSRSADTQKLSLINVPMNLVHPPRLASYLMKQSGDSQKR